METAPQHNAQRPHLSASASSGAEMYSIGERWLQRGRPLVSLLLLPTVLRWFLYSGISPSTSFVFVFFQRSVLFLFRLFLFFCGLPELVKIGEACFLVVVVGYHRKVRREGVRLRRSRVSSDFSFFLLSRCVGYSKSGNYITIMVDFQVSRCDIMRVEVFV